MSWIRVWLQHETLRRGQYSSKQSTMTRRISIEKYGFLELPENKRKLFLPMKTIAKLFSV
jgi:hypothetical protein